MDSVSSSPPPPGKKEENQQVCLNWHAKIFVNHLWEMLAPNTATGKNWWKEILPRRAATSHWILRHLRKKRGLNVRNKNNKRLDLAKENIISGAVDWTNEITGRIHHENSLLAKWCSKAAGAFSEKHYRYQTVHYNLQCSAIVFFSPSSFPFYRPFCYDIFKSCPSNECWLSSFIF